MEHSSQVMQNEKKKRIPIKVREATRQDIPALIELNKAAYPMLAEENVVWGEAHLLSHQRLFPRGQLVAECRGRIVGAAASLVVNLGADPLRNHTWAGITDSGFFTNHDPDGDTLYGADVCTHPEHRDRARASLRPLPAAHRLAGVRTRPRCVERR